MKEKRKIISDIDGVLIDFNPVLNKYYNKRFGTNFEYKDYLYYDLEKVWKCPRQQVIDVVSDFYRSREFLDLRPMKDAPEVIEILSRNYEFSAATNRPASIKRETKHFLDNFFGRIFKNVFINGQYHLSSLHLDKTDYCLDNNAFILFEDNLDITKKAAEKGIQVFLFDNLSNREKGLPDKIKRVGVNGNHWKQILEYLA